MQDKNSVFIEAEYALSHALQVYKDAGDPIGMNFEDRVDDLIRDLD